ncbi:hypothetical protein BHM03_00041846 [Ensete ventricosum]|nr:hypothetical protein BHM03_00041846 [Ensete ventricosum]
MFLSIRYARPTLCSRDYHVSLPGKVPDHSGIDVRGRIFGLSRSTKVGTNRRTAHRSHKLRMPRPDGFLLHALTSASTPVKVAASKQGGGLPGSLVMIPLHPPPRSCRQCRFLARPRKRRSPRHAPEHTQLTPFRSPHIFSIDMDELAHAGRTKPC